MLAGVTVTAALAPGMRRPGAGFEVTVYCAAPTPVTGLIAQFMSAEPLLLTVKV